MAKPADRSDGEKEFTFNNRDFDRVRGLIYQRAGISLSDSKQEMVYSRLARRLRATGINTFSIYLDMLEREINSNEWESFTNALTTNLTSFFREEHHFPILAEHVKKKSGHLRVWCSASSTGEEPYSIAICICEALGTIKPNVEIIATDIDTNVLSVAARGVYNADRIEKLPNDIVRKYFLKGRGKNEGTVLVRPELRQLISFESLNLLEDRWSLSGEFDAIFCRNVMIYFDKPTQSSILKKFVPLLKSDGLLFAGHSENFLYVSDDFKLRGKTVYVLASQEDKRKKSNSYDLNKG
jgi:chemotaxis protein methyltransferase CheR